MKFWICPDCGDHNDFGERCDCENENKPSTAANHNEACLESGISQDHIVNISQKGELCNEIR